MGDLICTLRTSPRLWHGWCKSGVRQTFTKLPRFMPHKEPEDACLRVYWLASAHRPPCGHGAGAFRELMHGLVVQPSCPKLSSMACVVVRPAGQVKARKLDN